MTKMKPVLIGYFILSALTFAFFIWQMKKELDRSFKRHEPVPPNVLALVIVFIIVMMLETVAAITLMLT